MTRSSGSGWDGQVMNGLELDRHILNMARRQFGLVSRRQLMDSGVESWLIDGRIRSLRLVPLIQGVYAVGHDRQGVKARLMAGLLFAGDGAVLSHQTTGANWGIMNWRGAVHVTRNFNRVLPGRERDSWLTVHRTRFLPPEDVDRHNGFPVTSVERTLVDLAGTLTTRKLESCLVEAHRLRLINTTRLEKVLKRGRGRKGVATLRKLVIEWNSEIMRTRSDLEEEFFSLCRERGVGIPNVNVIVEGFEVDCFWPQHRLVVEMDSRKFHLNEDAFENDRIRDGVLQAAGYRVGRITYKRLERDPESVLRSIVSLIQ